MTLQRTFLANTALTENGTFSFEVQWDFEGFQLSLNTAGGTASDSQFQAPEAKAKDTQHLGLKVDLPPKIWTSIQFKAQKSSQHALEIVHHWCEPSLTL